MRRKDEIKMRVISNIDDDILETVSCKRYELCTRQPKKRKNFPKFVIIGVAAVLIVAMMLAVLPMLFNNKQVPIYQGMSVSTVAPRANNALAAQYQILSMHTPLLGSMEQTTDQTIEDSDAETTGQSTDLIPTFAEMYYAKPMQDIYITVHVHNPDNFEILSFTLNGKKYSSYMFEDGSDMEHLILKYNVGDVEGVQEYTIDAIKYIDGTQTKDVVLDGDRTVRVGVYTEKQPVATVSEPVITYNEISLDVSIADELALIGESDGAAYAVLYAGETEVARRQLSCDGSTVSILFDGLITHQDYILTVEAEYDSLDGSGKGLYELYRCDLQTEEIARIELKNVSYDSATFDVLWDEEFDNQTITSMSLYLDDALIGTLSSDITVIEGLLSGRTYTLVATYINQGAEEQISCTFTTQGKAVPSVKLTKGESTQANVSFDVEINDPDGLCELTLIELLLNGEVVATAENPEVRAFADLLSDNQYTVRVTYTYDLRDGQGVHTETAKINVSTLSKKAPTFLDRFISATMDSIAGEYKRTDPDGTFISAVVSLYQGETLIAQGDSLTVDFSGLEDYTEYTLVLSYTYDRGDGKGVQNGEKRTTRTTHPYIAVTECSAINTQSFITVGDKIYLRAKLDNPHGVKIDAVTVKGVEYQISPSSETLIFEIELDDQFAGGETDIWIESVRVNNRTVLIQDAACATVFIHGKIEPVSIYYADENYQKINWALPEQTVYKMIKIHNPTGYALEEGWIKLDDQRYYQEVTLEEGVNTCSFDPIGYSNELVSGTFGDDRLVGLCFLAKGIKAVSTKEDLRNMQDGYYYQLINDIDLASENWLGVDLYGVFDGNGYAIKNLTCVGTDTDLGLFIYATGAIENLQLHDCVILATGNSRVGSIVVRGVNLQLYNCHVDQNSSIDNVTNSTSSVGGLIWEMSTGTISHCSNGADINVGTIGYNGTTIVGGIACGGTFVIENCINYGTITSTDRYPFSCGGIVDYIAGSVTVRNCLNLGQIEAYDSVSHSIWGATICRNAQFCDGYVQNCLNVVDSECPLVFVMDKPEQLVNSYSLTDYPTNQATAEKLNSKEFYTETLGWSEEEWDFSDLDVNAGKFPTLK